MVRSVDRRRPASQFSSPAGAPPGGQTHRSRRRGYRVRIVYTEPTFQARLADPPADYSIEYLVTDAGSPEEARAAALREWDFCRLHSGVGWIRSITGIAVDRPKGPLRSACEITCR